jgi:hypothetical protein
MTNKICLRCDWAGETLDLGCPRCGVKPLYVVGVPTVETPRSPVSRPLEERDDVEPATDAIAPVVAEPPGPSPPEPDTTGSSGRSARSAVVSVITALALVVTLGNWLEASPPVEGAPTPSRSPSASPTPESAPVEVATIRSHAQSAGPVTISFSAPRLGWERHDRFSMNRSVMGPQSAEAVIFWTGFPDGGLAHPCARVLDPSVAATAADLAAAVARAPGTDLVAGPSDVTVGGHAAKRVVLSVREDVGCGPGFFYAWDETNGGAFWGRHTVADTIRIWIVDVAGTPVFIEAETTDQATPELEREIRQIVGTTRFQPTGRQIARKVARKVAIAERFMRARNAYDAETALSLLDDDEVAARLVSQQLYDGWASSMMPTVRLSPGKVALALEVERLYGVRYRAVDCRRAPDRHDPHIICSYRMASRLRRILGRPPLESSVALRIRHGRIDFLSFPWLNISFDPGGIYPAEFEGFVRWLEVEHPDAGSPFNDGTLFRTIGQELVLNLTDESLLLLKRYLRGFEHSVDA